ncbi:MAG: iron donor protein CyaY [Pelagibacterales bacterium]|nr:iron donor protein CyaY [Pelagibacterales bacterium]
MLEQKFHTLSESTLISLADKIEALDKKSELDVEYSDGILTILIESSSKQYVINKHSASQKIWYSSPFSGANYFSFDENTSKWLDLKGDELENKLLAEIKKVL